MYILFVFTWIGKEKLSKRLRFLCVSIACTIFFISADNVFLLCLYCNVVHSKQIVKYTHTKKGKNIGYFSWFSGVWNCHARLIRLVHRTGRTSRFSWLACPGTSKDQQIKIISYQSTLERQFLKWYYIVIYWRFLCFFFIGNDRVSGVPKADKNNQNCTSSMLSIMTRLDCNDNCTAFT